ncbi:putative transposase, Ptta/En/Spm, plant [Rosa chinensis]|uniref:Putative transposase, Ptta/En/Spm, plant n=1 Tax=Rosa chinensis TaxID=74649 RepID=A0A2P6RU42_ROSCH|nr:putative transposase, Ptta/En/Spm, plant [Rosa chinensis]
MRMMNIPTANNTNIGRLESSPPINMNETLSSSDNPNVGNEVPTEPGVNDDESGAQSRPLNIPSVGNEVPTELGVNIDESGAQSRLSKKRKRKTRKTRGKNKPKFGLQGREKLQFNAIGQPVAPDDKVAQLGRFIGQLAAECSNFPLNAKNWAELCRNGKVEEAWLTIQDALDWSDPETLALASDIKDVIVDKLHERWKSFKYKMKKKWYTPFKGMERRFICGNKHIHAGQWRALVSRWDETKNQEVAETNITNRQQLKLHQTTGTKTYAQMRYQWVMIS